jgi:hypothetical protein
MGRHGDLNRQRHRVAFASMLVALRLLVDQTRPSEPGRLAWRVLYLKSRLSLFL